MLRPLLLALPAFALVACAGGGSEATTGSSSDLTTVSGGVQPASKQLYEQLFTDADTTEAVGYTLLGHLPSSTEQCFVQIQRAGLPPLAKNAWSQISITPLGESYDTVTAHGPVEVAFATTSTQSKDVQAFTSSGSSTTYSETDDANRTLTLKLGYADGAKSWSTIKNAAIDGEDIAAKKSASCVDTAPLAVLKASEYGPVAQAAADQWAQDNNESLDDDGIVLESCTVSSPSEIACAFGNDTNEETLDMTFELLAGGKLGRMRDASRHSDFENQ